MFPNIIKSNKALAAVLGVTPITICRWKAEGVLDDAIVSEFRKTIIYDINKVFECLNHKGAKPGRKRTRI